MSGGLVPPSAIAAASSAFSRRSAWLNFGSNRANAMRGPSTVMTPRAIRRSRIEPRRASFGRSGNAAATCERGTVGMPRPRLVQPAEHANDAVLQFRHRRDRRVDRPSRTDPHRHGLARLTQGRRDLVERREGDPGVAAQQAGGGGVEAAEVHRGGEAGGRVGRGEAR